MPFPHHNITPHRPPPYHRAPPPPPPPPPPPHAVMPDDGPGSARCYFCGKLVAEQDVEKTKHSIGHGYEIFAIICPACKLLKDRNEGPFELKLNFGAVFLGFVMLIVVIVAARIIWSAAHGGMVPFSETELPINGERTATAGGLTLTVDRIQTGMGGFRVWLTATNNTTDSLTLPLFGYFFVTDEHGNQYEADPFSSTFPREAAPGATVSGYANMKRSLAAESSRLKVGFSTVFGSFQVRAITVEGVTIR